MQEDKEQPGEGEGACAGADNGAETQRPPPREGHVWGDAVVVRWPAGAPTRRSSGDLRTGPDRVLFGSGCDLAKRRYGACFSSDSGITYMVHAWGVSGVLGWRLRCYKASSIIILLLLTAGLPPAPGGPGGRLCTFLQPVLFKLKHWPLALLSISCCMLPGARVVPLFVAPCGRPAAAHKLVSLVGARGGTLTLRRQPPWHMHARWLASVAQARQAREGAGGDCSHRANTRRALTARRMPPSAAPSHRWGAGGRLEGSWESHPPTTPSVPPPTLALVGGPGESKPPAR